MTEFNCRFCGAPLCTTFCNLGTSPLSNAYLVPERLKEPEVFYPLHAFVCEECYLVQLPQLHKPEEIFSDYAYFSSYSDSWLAHARRYAGEMMDRLALGPSSQVVEIASNDGYLLRYFRDAGIPVLGIEPAENVAQVAREAGVPTLMAFFGAACAERLAGEGTCADLLLGNNVLAHVPDLNDFVAGLKRLLAPTGVITMEFPHLLRLMSGNQFDTIYHEHFSYFSFLTVEQVFVRQGLRLFDVQELSTHGGSLRIFATHMESPAFPATEAVVRLKRVEVEAGLDRVATYHAFAEQVGKTKRQLLTFLIHAKEAGKSIVGYGAPAKGNTLLNYCGVRTDLLEYTVDRSPHKQGRYLPGTRIPIRHPDRILETKPDYVLILPWNLRDEITEQMSDVRSWGGRFVVPIPALEVLR
jgi:SAM-dependent methyltransferase